MTLGRWWCAVVSLPGSILMVGGYAGGAATNTVEALSLESMTFAAGPTMRTARSGYAASVLPQDHSPRRTLIVGGRDGTSESFTAKVLTTAG